jgi:hypothetical protein
MNEELKDLYNSHWNLLQTEASKLSVNAAYPLLIKVDQKYIDSDIKVMIVGQETDGWIGDLKNGSFAVEYIMNEYSDYFCEREKHGKRAFWNRKNFRYFEEKLTTYFSNKDVSFIWNNISKIGSNGRGIPSSSIKKLERSCFNIFLSEFKILKPDIVIFTTGSSRDSYIKHHFGSDVSFEPKLSLINGGLETETLDLIAEVNLPQFSAVKAVRIEHPNRRTLSNVVTLQVIKNWFEKET